GVPLRQQPRDLSQERDRWFESGSLQRRVCKLSVPERRTPASGSKPEYNNRHPAFAQRVMLSKSAGRSRHLIVQLVPPPGEDPAAVASADERKTQELS